MSVLGNTPLLMTPEGYQISRSVRLRRSASAYFNRTFGTPTNANIWSLSGWTKRGLLGTQISLFGASVSSYTSITFLAGDTLRINLGNGTNGSLVTTQVFRDPSAFYHVVIAYDSTQAIASNRIKLYINGVQVTSFSTANYPSQNVSAEWNYSGAVGTIGTAATEYFDGYLTEINFIDGQALTPSSFGETDAVTGVWKPKKYAGTYGTNGFYLNFSDNSNNTAATIGKDYSGNGNNWTPNNISVTAGVTYDSMLDTPTPYADGGNGRGNYAVLNAANTGNGGATISQGNLAITSASTGWKIAYSTIAMTSGKWYCEFSNASGNWLGGLALATTTNFTNYLGSDATGYGYDNGAGNKYTNGAGSAYGASFTSSDVVGVAFDADNGTLTFYKNGTSQGTAFTGLTNSAGYYFAISQGGGVNTSNINFGQRPFAYTPPTGFKALNTQNLPDSTIKAGNKYFNAVTYTGDGVDGRTVSGAGFQPDLVWVKNRNSASYWHTLIDAVRGADRNIWSNSTAAEQLADPNGSVGSFVADGFTAKAGSTGIRNTNGSAEPYIAWQWKESATAGFDIVTYTGTGVARTVAHSLGVAPAMFIVKSRVDAYDWNVYHQAIGNTKYLALNNTIAATVDSTAWNNTSPTSSVFTVGSGLSYNKSGSNFIAYLFAEVAGFSKFGKYTGNGSADGPFVFTGFRPRFVMIKRTDSGGSWYMLDTSRGTYNVVNPYLIANGANTEATDLSWDILSNGFKLRSTYVDINASGSTYIFAAFAENPFKNSLAR